MLKRKYAPRFFREHPVLTRTLGYAAFMFCFAFPPGSTKISLNVFLFCGLMGLCLPEAYGAGERRLPPAAGRRRMTGPEDREQPYRDTIRLIGIRTGQPKRRDASWSTGNP